MADEVWTVRRILEWTCGYLERKGDEHPRRSAEWLLANACGLSRVEIYMNFDKPLSAPELDVMRDGVRRRGAGEPLQYVTGEMPFRHIVLRCEKDVLIPRPETEVLVDVALEALDAAVASGAVWPDVEERMAAKEAGGRASQEAREEELEAALVSEAEGDLNERRVDELLHELAQLRRARKAVPAGARVLDLCTGTGCIALSIASERPGTHVVATDLSARAVSLALRNRDALGLVDAVDVLECDLAADVPADLAGTFSVLVSNPPYIPSDVLAREVPSEVKDHEPELALDGGPDGLDVFRRILALAPRMLAPGGTLCVELFEGNVHAAADLVRAEPGWKSVEVRNDLTHRPRVLVAVRERW